MPSTRSSWVGSSRASQHQSCGARSGRASFLASCDSPVCSAFPKKSSWMVYSVHRISSWILKIVHIWCDNLLWTVLVYWTSVGIDWKEHGERAYPPSAYVDSCDDEEPSKSAASPVSFRIGEVKRVFKRNESGFSADEVERGTEPEGSRGSRPLSCSDESIHIWSSQISFAA